MIVNINVCSKISIHKMKLADYRETAVVAVFLLSDFAKSDRYMTGLNQNTILQFSWYVNYWEIMRLWFFPLNMREIQHVPQAKITQKPNKLLYTDCHSPKGDCGSFLFDKEL